MKYVFYIAIFVLISNQSFSQNAFLPNDLVDPFIGVEGGNIFPGVSLPFGMLRLGPNVAPPNNTNGYSSTKPIVGFSHTHTSGTGGGPRYGNFLVVPLVGTVDRKDLESKKKINEYAAPGYYRVDLARKPGDVACELTGTTKVGFHRYRFYTWQNEAQFNANLLINISSTNTRGKATDSRCLYSETKVLSSTEVQGMGEFAGGWGGEINYKIYFYAITDTPFESVDGWADSLTVSDVQELKGKQTGLVLKFLVKQQQTIGLKVAISFLSVEQAKMNMAEIPHWDFDKVRAQADAIWNQTLSTIKISGGSQEHRRLFYSLLRNTMIMPTNVTGENPYWDPTRPHYWEHYCLWDVFRVTMPLHTLIMPEHQVNVINSLLDIYKNKGWLPDGWIAGKYADIQGGTSADVVIADAVIKGLTGFDYNLAYEAMLKNANGISENPRINGRYITDYNKLGYVTSTTADGASSRSLEYYYNDYCIAQVAGVLGKEKDKKLFLSNSMNYTKLFYPEYKYFWAKDAKGNWMPNFSVTSSRPDSWNDPYFYEGGSMTYSAYVPQDMQGLINLHGGNQYFINYLDTVFASHFDLGNEPLFLLPYQYIYAARPDKTAYRVNQILKTQYLPALAGLPGQDDSGAMSAWFVFSAMGIFPVAGQDVYLIGTPAFDKVEMKVGGDRIFIIKAINRTLKSIYIQKATLNGVALNQAWFKHSDIIKGGTLELEMGENPSGWGTSVLPPSLSKPKI